MGKIFISYAREEDDAFVERLYRELGGSFDVWWDKTSMRSRSLTFLHEIREAIRAADHVLVILGPRALGSRYVQQEWQYALSLAKIVIPVLREGDMESLPPELGILHARNFRSEPFEAEFPRLLQDLSAPPPKLGQLYGDVPEPPAHYRPRPSIISQLAMWVTRDLHHPEEVPLEHRVTVLHGMGGLGKTVTAASYARMTGVRRIFGDGILWLAFETAPQPLAVLQIIGSALAPDATRYGDTGSAVAHLREALTEQACLIVLDNVADVELIRCIRGLLGVDGRLLVTAREAGPARELNTFEVQLDLLSHPEDLELLADWSGQSAEPLPDASHYVLAKCGGHPFAIALCGALVANGRSWDRLVRDLDSAKLEKIDARLERYQYTNIISCLGVSFDALDARAAPRMQELLVFHGDGGIPEPAVRHLWAATGNLDADGAEDMISDLAKRALVTTTGRAPARGLTLHSLVRGFLASKTADAAGMHARLLASYGETPREWLGAPNDGYFFQHLAYHLVESGRTGQIHELLSLSSNNGRNAWYELLTSRGLSTQFARDVEIAQRLAAGNIEKTNEPNETAPDWALVLRYALYLASLTSRASRIPTGLLVRLLQQNSMTFDEAMEHASRTPDPEQRAARWAAIATIVPERQPAVLKAALTLRQESARAVALGKLAPRLDASFLNEVVQAARGIIVPVRRAAVFLALASRHEEAGGSVIEEAEQAAKGIDDPEAAARALASVAGFLIGEQKVELLRLAFEKAKNAPRMFGRSKALGEVAPLLARAGLVDEALTALQSDVVMVRNLIEDPLIPELPPDRLLHLWNTIRNEPTEKNGHYAALIAVRLPEPERDEAFQFAMKITEGGKSHSNNGPLARLIDTVPPDLLDTLSAQALQAPDFIKLRMCKRVVDEDRFDLARRLTDAMSEPLKEVQACAWLLQKLSGNEREVLLRRCRMAIGRISSEKEWQQAVDAVASWLSPDVSEEMRNVALHDTNENDMHCWAQASIAGMLEEPRRSALVSEAVAAAQSRNARTLCLVWSSTADDLPKPLRDKLPNTFLRLADANMPVQWNFLSPLAALISEDAISEIVTGLSNVSEGARTRALKALRPRLSSEHLRQALAFAGGDHWDPPYLQLLERLAELNPGEALDMTESLHTGTRQIDHLNCILPKLDPAQLDRAFEIARQTVAAGHRDADSLPFEEAQLLEELSRRGLAERVATLAMTVDDPPSRLYLLAHITPYMPAGTGPPVWPDVLEAVKDESRPEEWLKRLLYLHRRAPPSFQAVVIEQGLEASRRINDSLAIPTTNLSLKTGLGVAWLTNVVDESHHSALFELSLAILSDQRWGIRWERAQTLLDLAPVLPFQLLERAREVALSIEDDSDTMNARATAVYAVAHRSFDAGRYEAGFDLVREIKSPVDRSLVLASLIEREPPGSAGAVLPVARYLLAQSAASRRDVFADLAGMSRVIRYFGSSAIAEQILSDARNVNVWWP